MSKYEYVCKNKVKEYKENFNEILSEMENHLNNKDYKLQRSTVGSAKRNLVLKQCDTDNNICCPENNNDYDIDWNLIFVGKNKNKVKIREEIHTFLEDYVEENDEWKFEDSTSTIKIKKDNNQIRSDIQITHNNKGAWNILVRDKKEEEKEGNSGRIYKWNQLSTQEDKEGCILKQIKGEKKLYLKDVYKDKYEQNGSNEKKAFSLYLESINETKNKYGLSCD